MARALIAALEHAGHHVEISSIFRSRDGKGDANRQARLRNIGLQIADRIIRQYTTNDVGPPDLWFTYHVYYKAPDWIGPRVSASLGIPYVIAEASHAPKRQSGPWAIGHDGAADAIRAADRIVGINSSNIPCVAPLLDGPERLIPLRPFLDSRPFEIASRQSAKAAGQSAIPVLITTAMMRPGDKLASYRLLAKALRTLDSLPWRLVIIGDGAARAEIESLMAPLGDDRVKFLGQRETDEMPELLSAADIFVWPAVNEAYGMAILEAQATGLPVIAGNAGGVSEIVSQGTSGLLTPEGNVIAFAEAIAELVADPARRNNMSKIARTNVAKMHSLKAASTVLNDIVTDAHQRRAA